VRSRNSFLRTRWIASVAAGWLFVMSSAAVHSQTATDSASDAEIVAAIDKVKADPNLAQERKTRTLRWQGGNKPSQPSSFGRWITNFFIWLAQLSRVLMWVVGGVLAAALLISLYRMLRNIDTRPSQAAAVVPTHVRDLDIRPESLPDDIGAAALDLWQRGEHRAALALLYRGLLSRLAHAHQVPIRDSTTEGDCVALAAKHLDAARKDYVIRLIRIWQRATYGGRDAQDEDVQSLCSEFAAALAPVSRARTAP
jgi:Domain of unknown function (DUF4129)